MSMTTPLKAKQNKLQNSILSKLILKGEYDKKIYLIKKRKEKNEWSHFVKLVTSVMRLR
jgi:hypothetical protein